MFLARPDARTLVVLASEAAATDLEHAGALAAVDGPGTHWLASTSAVRRAARLGDRAGVDLGTCSAKLDTTTRYDRVRWLALYSRRARSRQIAADQRLRPALDWRGERRLAPIAGVSVEGRLRIRANRPELLAVAGSPVVRPLLSAALLRGVPVDPRVEAAIEGARPSLVILPLAGPRDLATDAIRVARRRGIPTLAVVVRLGGEHGEEALGIRPVEEALAVRPAHVAVWGAHSRDHLVRVHGFPPEAVVPIGAPGFDGGSDSSRAVPGLPPSSSRVGSQLPASPSRTASGLGTSGIAGTETGDSGGSHVLVVGTDGETARAVRAAVAASGRGFAVAVEDAYANGARRSRIAGAAVVCTPRADVVLEAATLGRRTAILELGDAREARRGRAGPADHARWQGVEKVRGVRLCRDLSDLTRWLDALESWPAPEPTELGYWIHRDERPYVERLGALVAEMLRCPPRCVTLRIQGGRRERRPM
jgi:hypothetical protein